MAIVHQAYGQVIQPVQPIDMPFFNNLPKIQFGCDYQSNSTSEIKVFETFFQRVYKKYSSINIENIEKLVKIALKKKDLTFIKFIKDETLLKDTFLHKAFEIKTPLGQVIQELVNSQEVPNRKLLSKEIFEKADEEAIILLQKSLKKLSSQQNKREISTTTSSPATTIGLSAATSLAISSSKISTVLSSISSSFFTSKSSLATNSISSTISSLPTSTINNLPTTPTKTFSIISESKTSRVYSNTNAITSTEETFMQRHPGLVFCSTLLLLVISAPLLAYKAKLEAEQKRKDDEFYSKVRDGRIIIVGKGRINIRPLLAEDL